MLSALQKVASIAFLLVLAAGIAVAIGHFVEFDDRPELDWYRYILATNATAQFAEELPRKRDVEKVLLVPVVRDSVGTKQSVTEMLHAQVKSAAKYSIVTGDALEGELREEFMKNPPTRPLDAARYAAALGADGALLVHLEAFDPGAKGKGASIKLAGAIYDAKTGAAVAGTETRYEETVGGIFDPTYFAAWMHERSGGWRVVVWALFAALLPIATAPLAIEVLRQERNAWNAGLVAGYTAVDGLFALFLCGFYVPGTFVGALVALGTAASLAFNFVALDRVDDLRK